MRGSLGLGLILGLIVGAGGMYLTLRPPWGGGASTPPPGDGSGPVAAAPTDAGIGKPKGKAKRRPGARTVPAQGNTEEYEETEPVKPLTAAERALEWRGDEVALPPQKIDMTAGSEARPLDDGEINTTINSQFTGVRDCVIQGATGTDLHATITVKLLVDGTGRVSRSRLQAPRALFDRGLLGCAQRALGRMKFPATGGPTVVTLPVTLG